MNKFFTLCCLLLAVCHERGATQLTALDSSFSSDGIVEVDSLQRLGAGKTHLAIQADGKILTAGTYGYWSTSQYEMGALLMRFHPDGRVDSTFGQAGVARLRGNANENTIGLHILPNGRIITGTATGIWQGNSYTLHRLMPNGSPDSTFNDSGKVVYRPNPSPGNTYYRHLSVQADGKILMTGEWWQPPLSNFLNVFRHNANGSPDSSYGYFGRSSNGLPNTYRITGHTMALQPDGKLLVAGSAQDTPLWHNRNKAVVARCNPDGILDTSFNGGTGHIKYATPGERASSAHSLALQPDGKILVATISQRRFEGPWLCGVLRLHADGRLDSTFGINGKVETDSIRSNLALHAPPQLALQADGRILLSYTEGLGLDSQKFAVRRLLANGSPDLSFGSDGRVSTRVSASRQSHASSITVQANGRIVVTGVNVPTNSGATSLGIVRYHPYITLPSAIAVTSELLPTLHIFPNPARHAVYLSYALDEAADVHVMLCDAQGRGIRVLGVMRHVAGYHEDCLQLPKDAQPGQYILTVSGGKLKASSILTIR
jgi:uncharacterized delta-60 repeat protein